MFDIGSHNNKNSSKNVEKPKINKFIRLSLVILFFVVFCPFYETVIQLKYFLRHCFLCPIGIQTSAISNREHTQMTAKMTKNEEN